MQTFLPWPDYNKSAQSLDRQRLGKQRIEGYQIIQAIRGLSFGWRNHPASRMWRGHERHLVRYVMAVCQEWRRRGYKDTFMDRMQVIYPQLDPATDTPPPWLGDEAFHRSHQSNLIRKLPDHYIPQFPGVPNNLPYIWPA